MAICAYVANVDDDSVSVIDTASNTVIATITTGIGAQPITATVSPDGRKAYVANNSSNTVSVIDTLSNTVSGSAISVGTAPYGIAFTPNGALAFVVNTAPSAANGTVSVINVATAVIIDTIPVGNAPLAVAISPDGTTAYVTNAGGNSVSVIDIASLTVTDTITTGIGTLPHGVAVSPDGTRLYVSNAISGTVSIIDTGTLTPITGSPVTVGGEAECLAITPDGTQLYVGNGPSTSAAVSVINTSTLAVTTISTGTGSEPFGVAVTPDGTQAYVSINSSGVVKVIDTATNTIAATITVGNNPAIFTNCIQPPSIPMTNIPYTAPQGRLTLTSNTPVMTADATGQTSVYYTPYQGNIVPVYDGANMQSYTFGQLTMSLNTSNQLSGNIYDLFIFLNSSVVTIGAGPAWSSSTSRGTGAGTTQLQQTNGLWVNANTITLKNGSTTYSNIPVGEATYVGSAYMTANGQTGVSLKPAAAANGTANIIGLYNAYNRLRMTAYCRDSSSGWTYGTASWRAADSSASNKISFIDGLQQSQATGQYSVFVASATDTIVGSIGLNIDSSTTTPTIASQEASAVNQTSATQIGVTETFYPVLGLHYIQAVEYSSGGTTSFFGSNGPQVMALSVSLDM